MKTKTIVFIDASNIIYGTRDEGWKVDFKKLYKYLVEYYETNTVYYFTGKDLRNIKQSKFYEVLQSFGYELIIKPVKFFKDIDGKISKKANCDVDLTFFAMRDIAEYDRGIFMTGDGDFEILFRYLIDKNKIIKIISNTKRTAHEIKKIAGGNFIDFGSLRPLVELNENKKRQTLRKNLPHEL